MAKVGVALALIKSPVDEAKALVLDGIRTSDRPSALGFFLLNAFREWYTRFGEFPAVTLKVGLVEHEDLAFVETNTTLLNDDWFGRIYELVLAVERNDPGLIGRYTDDPPA